MFAEKPAIGAEEEFEELLDGSREGKSTINMIMSEKITPKTLLVTQLFYELQKPSHHNLMRFVG